MQDPDNVSRLQTAISEVLVRVVLVRVALVRVALVRVAVCFRVCLGVCVLVYLAHS